MESKNLDIYSIVGVLNLKILTCFMTFNICDSLDVCILRMYKRPSFYVVSILSCMSHVVILGIKRLCFPYSVDRCHEMFPWFYLDFFGFLSVCCRIT